MDNLGSHRRSAVRQAKERPVQSCSSCQILANLKPIEILFSKLKHGLRKAANVPSRPIQRYREPPTDHLFNPLR